MSDLFANLEEHHSERLAIIIESNVPDPVGAAAEDLRRFEVRDVIRRYYPNGPVAEYFKIVEKHRGKAATDSLKADCRIAWAAHHANKEAA